MEPLSTKSIDVGGIFLMDMSVNESASSTTSHLKNDSPPSTTTEVIGASHSQFLGCPSNISQDVAQNGRQSMMTTTSKTNPLTSSIAGGYEYQTARYSNTVYRHPDYLGSSLDRLASVINCDEQQRYYQQQQQCETDRSDNVCFDDEPNVTLVEPHQPPPFHDHDHRHTRHSQKHNHHQRNPNSFNEVVSSFSDESYAASSDASLSASFTGCSEEDDEDGDGYDRDSTTTREDSGVLDMKDLEIQLNGYNSYEDKNHINAKSSSPINNHQQDQQASDDHHSSEKTAAKNLTSNKVINKANVRGIGKNSHNNYHHDRPTESDNDSADGDQARRHYSQHHNHHHLITSNGRRRVSASVPIQVPARQMRKDLNKMKLNLLREEQAMEQDLALFGPPTSDEVTSSKPTTQANNKSQNLAIFEDDDAFLDQEFNANHHNHYSLSEHGDENLTAGDDPMKLFASIQALAKSLHDDTEIFGSLPPKRTLESPIRSMALV